jgi:hypothetical protein
MLVGWENYFPMRCWIGEIGAQNETDGFPNPTYSEKVRIAKRYTACKMNSTKLSANVSWRLFLVVLLRDAQPEDGKGSIWPVLNELLSSLNNRQ